MQPKIKYRIKSKPRRIKKIADVTIGIGAIILIIGDWILGPFFRSIPLELWVVVVSEILPVLFTNMWVTGLIILYIGMYLLTFNWYKGTVTFNMSDESIYITGKISMFFDFVDISEINIFSNDLLSKNSIRFDIPYDRISFKFKNRNELGDFIEGIIPLIKKHEIVMNNWEH